MIAALLPAGANASLIQKIIEALVTLIPIIVQEYNDLLLIVKNIIFAVKGDPAATAEQLDALDAMEAQLDADYEAASAAAAAEDAAAAAGAS